MAETKIMVVDDDPETCATLSDIFQDKGYSVVTASAGKEAIEKAGQTALDAALIDIKLPDMDGTAVLEELKTRHPEIVSIIITGYASIPNAVKALHDGARGYFVKPLVIEDVLSRLEDSLDKQRLQRELRESEEKYRGLVETSTSAIISIDEERKIIQWNEAASRIFGYSEHEVTGKLIDILISKKHLRQHTEGFKSFLQSGESKLIGKTTEFEALRKDGAVVPVEISLSTLKRKGSWVFTEIIRDITERKQDEKALKESEARFRELFDDAPVGYHELDIEGRIVRVNRTELEMLGYAEEEMLGRHIWDFYVEREISKDRFKAKISGDMPIRGPYERTFRRKDGSLLPVLVETRVLRDEKGRIALLRATTQSIAELKKAEEELRITQFSVDHSAESIIWIGKDGRFLNVNEKACRSLGYSRDELLFIRVHDIDPQFSKKGVWKRHWREIKNYGYSTFESRYRTKDGRFIPVEITANYLAYNSKEFYAAFARDITERKQAQEQLKRRLDRLAALRAIDMAISSSLDLRVVFDVFLDHATAQLGVNTADILMIDPHTHRLEYAAGRGFRTDALKHTHLPLGKGFAGRAALERRIIMIANLGESKGLLKRSPLLPEEDFVSYFGAPLIAKGQVKGVLEIFHRSPLKPDKEWLDFLEAITAQAAIAIDNAAMFSDLQRSNMDLVQAYDSALEGWSRAMDLRDKETEGHSERVADMTLRLAGALGIRNSELAHMRRGALLHDIGKIGVPDSILYKPGPLSDEEWKIMRKHPDYALDLLSPIAFLRPALDIPYCHHEKWDGTGYPRGLKGEQIPLAARIFAVADVWDALRSKRPYRPAWTEKKAREYIREQAGKHFDPKVVKVFLEMLDIDARVKHQQNEIKEKSLTISRSRSS